jgi:hypothetical protein
MQNCASFWKGVACGLIRRRLHEQQEPEAACLGLRYQPEYLGIFVAAEMSQTMMKTYQSNGHG